MATVNVGGYDFYLHKGLQVYLDKIKEAIQEAKDRDWVILVDGYEGAGKSVFSMQIAKYVDPSLDLSRVCMTAEEFKEAIINAKRGQAVIYDEAVTGLSSTDSIRKVGRVLKSMMMQMRQKNLFVIIILPTVFELNKYAVLSRAKALFHVYERGNKRGFFVGYNKKDTRKTYLLGKKTHTYRVRSHFFGKFFGKYVVDEQAYRKKKEDALFQVDEDEGTENSKWLKQRNIILSILVKKLKLTLRETEKLMVENGVELKKSVIHNIIKG